MHLTPARLGHLSYCSNIHPGESWAETLQQLQVHLPELKRRLSPNAPFGIGLRLSAIAASELAQGQNLNRFKDWLNSQDLYVFTLNGFPYGQFHGTPVKEQVYRPDWRHTERLNYSNQLADLLAALLPEGEHGSISTLPGAFKGDLQGEEDKQRIADRLIEHVAHLVQLKQNTGRLIRLGLEPEPFCLLELRDEVLDFFGRYLHSDSAAERLAGLSRLSKQASAEALQDHLGVCLDACHAAVQFENPAETALAWTEAGIRIVKIQVSSALRLPDLDENGRAALREFDDSVYLHQTVTRTGDGAINRFLDIPDALQAGVDGAEWRTHFHVPVFHEDLGRFRSTTPQLRQLLELQRDNPVTEHLEVETYSFGVLPEEFQSDSVVDNIAREIDWTRQQLCP